MIEINLTIADFEDAGACQKGVEAAWIYWENKRLNPETDDIVIKWTADKCLELMTDPATAPWISWLVVADLLPSPRFDCTRIEGKKLLHGFSRSHLYNVDFEGCELRGAWVDTIADNVGIERTHLDITASDVHWNGLTIEDTCTLESFTIFTSTFRHAKFGSKPQILWMKECAFFDCVFPVAWCKPECFLGCTFHKVTWLGDEPPAGYTKAKGSDILVPQVNCLTQATN